MCLHTYLAFISSLKGDSISILPCFPKFQSLLGETYVACEKKVVPGIARWPLCSPDGRGFKTSMPRRPWDSVQLLAAEVKRALPWGRKASPFQTP